jgi:hypothetical protein
MAISKLVDFPSPASASIGFPCGKITTEEWKGCVSHQWGYFLPTSMDVPRAILYFQVFFSSLQNQRHKIKGRGIKVCKAN